MDAKHDVEVVVHAGPDSASPLAWCLTFEIQCGPVSARYYAYVNRQSEEDWWGLLSEKRCRVKLYGGVGGGFADLIAEANTYTFHVSRFAVDDHEAAVGGMFTMRVPAEAVRAKLARALDDAAAQGFLAAKP